MTFPYRNILYTLDLCNNAFFCLARLNYSKKEVPWSCMCDLTNCSTNKEKGDLKQGDKYVSREINSSMGLYILSILATIFSPISTSFVLIHSCSYFLYIIPSVPPFITSIITDLSLLLKVASTKEGKSSFVLQKYLIKINMRIR